MKPQAVAKESERVLELPPIPVSRVRVTIEGITGLISHRKGGEQLKRWAAKTEGKAQSKRGAKNPQAEYEASLYPHPEGGYGHPGAALRSAIIDACRGQEGVAMTEAKMAIHIAESLVKIEGCDPVMRHDVLPIGKRGLGSTDNRYRAEFPAGWRITFTVEFHPTLVKLEHLLNLINIAGWCVGIGDDRPMNPMNKGGSHGRFKLLEVVELQD